MRGNRSLSIGCKGREGERKGSNIGSFRESSVGSRKADRISSQFRRERWAGKRRGRGRLKEAQSGDRGLRRRGRRNSRMFLVV